VPRWPQSLSSVIDPSFVSEEGIRLRTLHSVVAWRELPEGPIELFSTDGCVGGQRPQLGHYYIPSGHYCSFARCDRVHDGRALIAKFALANSFHSLMVALRGTLRHLKDGSAFITLALSFRSSRRLILLTV